MKIIIQCASRKHKKAPTFKLDDGRNVTFVAQPNPIESRGDQVFADQMILRSQKLKKAGEHT